MAGRILILMVVILVLCVTGVIPGESGEEKGALEAATRWLALVDSEKYAESWTRASELFKASVKQEDWERMVREARRPLITLKQREMAGSKHETSLPGAPDGEYVVIQFKSVFVRRPAVETVTVTREKDGVWRVSGYFIR